MQQRDPGIETLFETGQCLRAQVDFRNQHQGLLAGREHSMDQLQIDLGLAAAGDARQQEGLKTTKAGADRFERRALLRIQRQLGLQQPAAAVLSRRTGATRFDSHQAFSSSRSRLSLFSCSLPNRAWGEPWACCAMIFRVSR